MTGGSRGSPISGNPQMLTGDAVRFLRIPEPTDGDGGPFLFNQPT